MNLLQEIAQIVAGAPHKLVQGALTLQINPHLMEANQPEQQPSGVLLMDWLKARGFVDHMPAEKVATYQQNNTLYVVYLKTIGVSYGNQMVAVGSSEWDLLNSLRVAVEHAKQDVMAA